MKLINKNERKTIQLDMLKFIDSVCKQNNIEYFINYGTLLGAVRHKGFIPWDDDIDISMYREDYSRFIDIVEQENNVPYKIISYENSDWYFHNFVILVDNTTIIPDIYKKKRRDTHLFIDIFPIDKFNNTTFIKKIAFYNSLRSISQTKIKYITHNNIYKNIVKKSLWFILYFFNPRFFTKKINNVIEKNSVKNGVYEGFVGMGDIKEIFSSNTFKDTIYLEFENIMFKAPKYYDNILKKYYGKYLELPPKEDRIEPHNFDVYKKL